MTDKLVKLWRRRSDGSLELCELRRSMFSSEDAFVEAVDFKYENGFDDELPDGGTT